MILKFSNLILTSSIAFLLAACNSTETNKKYSDFNPNNYTFEEVKLPISQEKVQKKQELEQLIKNKEFKVNSILKEDVKTYNLYEALNNKIKIEDNILKEKKDKYYKSLKGISTSQYVSYGSLNNMTITNDYIIVGDSNGNLTVLNKKDMKILRKYKVPKKEPVSSINSISKNKIILTTYSKDFYLFDLQKGKVLRTYKGHKRAINRAIVSNGLIYTTSKDNSIKIWKQNSSSAIYTIKSLDYDTFDIKKDGNYLYFSSYNNVHKFNLKTKKLVEKFIGAKREINTLIIKDNMLIAGSKAGYIDVWDKNSSKFIKRFKAHKSYVWSLDIKDDILYSASKDASIKMWEIKNNFKQLPSSLKQNKWINKVIVKDSFIYSCSDDKYLKRWDIKKVNKSLDLKNILNKQVSYIREIRTLAKSDSYDDSKKLELLKYSNILVKSTYKNGKIGQRYVPYTSTSYYNSKTDTTYINGKPLTISKVDKDTYSSGGNKESVYGYKAIYRVENHSNNNYYVDLKLRWNGKYSKYQVKKHGAWSDKSGTYRKLISNYTQASKNEKFFIASKDNFKFQFEAGEEKPSKITFDTLSIKKVPDEYFKAFKYAMEPKNQAVYLLEKFENDSKIKQWSSSIKHAKNKAQNILDEKFSKENIKNASASILYDEKMYDKDFDSQVKLNVKANKQAMCVWVKTAFGVKKVFAQNESGFALWKTYDANKSFTIKNISKQNVKKVEVIKVTPKCLKN